MSVAERRLAAIVAMDVAGFSCLIGLDEQIALARLPVKDVVNDCYVGGDISNTNLNK